MMAQYDPKQAAARAVAVIGGPVAAARLLNVKGHRHQTVQSWLRNRVPADYCPGIEKLTAERGERILCEQLRPDIDWAVLRTSVSDSGPGALKLAELERQVAVEPAHAAQPTQGAA